MSHAIVALLTAPFIGSFLGVLISRLPEDREIATGRSRCPLCDHALGPADLVPLLSFALLRGRCRHCGGPIAHFHWRVEIASLAVAAVAVAMADDNPTIWANCVLGWSLLALTWIDLRHLLLPDVLTLPLVLAGLGWTAWSAPESLTDHAAAAFLGWAALTGIAAAYRHWRGIDGLGGGDAKLLGAGGAWLGLAALPWLVVVAAALTIAGSMVAHRSFTRIGRQTALPFGPGLAAAIWMFQLIG